MSRLYYYIAACLYLVCIRRYHVKTQFFSHFINIVAINSLTHRVNVIIILTFEKHQFHEKNDIKI